MAIFSPKAKIETVNKCNDIRITDETAFDAPLTRDVFTSRTVSITDTKGAVTEYAFPMDGIAGDVLLIPNFYVGKDYYVTVAIKYVFDNEGLASTQTLIVNHISACNALQGRSKLLDLDREGCDLDIAQLTKIDTSMENAVYAAAYKLGEVAQAFLDQTLELIKTAENCK